MSYGEYRFAATPLLSAADINTTQPSINYKADVYQQKLATAIDKLISSPSLNGNLTNNINIKDFSKYQKAVDDYKPETLIGDIQNLTGNNDSIDYGTTAVRAFDYLKTVTPRRETQTLLGPKPLEPSDKDKYEWLRKVKVVDNPLSALTDNKNLTDGELEALKVVYPNLYQDIQALTIDRLAQMTEVEPEKAKQIGRLLDIPSADQEKLMAFQQSYSNPITDKQKPGIFSGADTSTVLPMTTGTKMGSDLIGI